MSRFKKAKELFYRLVAGIIFMVFYFPMASAWYWFIPDMERFAEPPFTFHLGVMCGVGVVVFAPLTAFLVWQALKSFRKLLPSIQ